MDSYRLVVSPGHGSIRRMIISSAVNDGVREITLSGYL